MDNWRFLCISLFLLFAIEAVPAQPQQSEEKLLVERGQAAATLNSHAPAAEKQSVEKRAANPSCLQWKNEACTVCGLDSTAGISVKNKTRTPVLLCRAMKPGPAKLVMSTHAEPEIAGAWEVEFGLGYQTSARTECPHQFIASNHLPLKHAYQMGPLTIEGEIPSDGMIQAMVCLGLSSARVNGEGKETGASLEAFELRVVSE